MEKYTVSVLLDSLRFLEADIAGLTIHGANLATASLLRLFAVHTGVFEVFLPPMLMSDTEALARAAAAVLPPERQGKGLLRFYPQQAIPEVWGDGEPRLLYCMDPEGMARDRYLRDRFAVGPMPIICDTHACGYNRLWGPLTRLADAPPVSFDSMACLSIAFRDAMAAFFGEERKPCRLDIHHHGVSTELFVPVDAAGKAAARQRLGLPADGRLTLYLGRVTAHDKADLAPLVRAFARAARTDDRLLIAGSPYPSDYGEHLRELGASVGLGPDRLLVHGTVSVKDRPAYYAAADLFVFPGDTVQEAQSNTTLEAMATGLPVILSDWDGMRDLVEEGVTGYLVPTYMAPLPERIAALSPVNPLMAEYLMVAQTVWVDTGALENRLRQLLSDSSLRERMGQAGRERAERLYRWSVILEGWTKLADELMASAIAETPEDQATRRAYADRLGLPTDYAHLFTRFPTRPLEPAQWLLRLTPEGVSVAEGRTTLRFHSELLPLVFPEVIEALFANLYDAEGQRVQWAALVEEVADETGRRRDDISYHVSLLLKRDLLETLHIER
jgi:glycosyltransferase involved in cell wall biosynthesis